MVILTANPWLELRVVGLQAAGVDQIFDVAPRLRLADDPAKPTPEIEGAQLVEKGLRILAPRLLREPVEPAPELAKHWKRLIRSRIQSVLVFPFSEELCLLWAES
jgi:hypothetical protein